MTRRSTMPKTANVLVPKALNVAVPEAPNDIAPKAPDVAALARQHTAAAVAALVELLGADDEKLRVTAAAALLDRGWGKPGQPAEAARPFDVLSDEQLTQAIDLLRKVIPSAKPPKQSRAA
jgi:hypothetical protein